ncbi:MAG: hypothetical protein HYZ43_01865 [Flavobacteriia bacterium]|nr:hypothetical protein [Flavobacteriia bacterium]
MKLPITVYGILALALTTVVVCGCNSESGNKQSAKSVMITVDRANNETISSDAIAEATLEAPTIVKVAFSVSGKLEKGELILEEGSHFKKGQLLYQINNREAFAALNRVKTELATKLVQLLPEIETQFPTEKNKWVRFMEELKPQYLVPALPPFKTSKERYLITEKGCLITEQPDNLIQTGKPIARIAKKESLHIKTEIGIDLLNAFRQKSTLVCTVQGDTIGNATYKKRTNTINRGTTKMPHWFELTLYRKRPVFHGMKVQLVIPKAQRIVVTKVPISALNEEKIQVFNNGKLREKSIHIIQRDSNKAFVSGLTSGEQFSVTFQQGVDPKTIYTAR